MIGTLAFHDVANIFPLMGEPELDALGWHIASRAPVYCTSPLYETLPTGTTWIRCTENGRELFILTSDNTGH